MAWLVFSCYGLSALDEMLSGVVVAIATTIPR